MAIFAAPVLAVAGPLEIPREVKLLITGTNQATVSWQDNATGETGFEIHRKTGDTGSWAQVQLPAANATSWSDAAVPAANYVYYRVRTLNGSSTSAWSHLAVLNNPGDSDADGIPDTVETSAGLDPTDWTDATKDLDGDGVPNLWEYALGKDMTNAADVPVPDVVVDSTFASETATQKKTIQAAINALPSNTTTPPFKVVSVAGGIYPEAIVIGSGRRVALIADSGSVVPPQIVSPTGYSAVETACESVIDGFRITHAVGGSGRGLFVDMAKDRYMFKLSNCMVFGNSSNSGPGVYQQAGRGAAFHCTFFDNLGLSGASGLGWSTYLGAAHAVIGNTIAWNASGGPTQYDFSGTNLMTIKDCVIRNPGTTPAITTDPLLNPFGYLKIGSSAIGAGGGAWASPWDIQLEARSGTVDIGADEFVDADADGIPDHYELGGDLLPGDDTDLDGLSNVVEYETYGTNPLVADTDGDGMTDGDEIAAGANPFDPDTDKDGMPDGYEQVHGLDPTSDRDRFADADGDRVPNFWEFKRGTSPSNPASVPATDYVVNPPLAGTGNNKATITAAVNSLTTSYYSIVRVVPGVYSESLLVATGKHVLFLADQVAAETALSAPAQDTYAIDIRADVVLDGFRVTRARDTDGITYNGRVGILIAYNAPHVRLSNCIITGHYSGAGGGAVQNGTATLELVHCTFYGNGATDAGKSLYQSSAKPLRILNSILWNENTGATDEIYRSSTSGLETFVANSIIKSGQYGGSTSNPQLTPVGYLKLGSPAIDAGLITTTVKDVHGEVRNSVPDIGADEYLDGDTDGIPDWLEAAGSLDPGLDHDSDGLNNLVEYETYSSNPRVADTDGDGAMDGVEVTAGSSPLLTDTDGDVMTDSFEIIHGLRPVDDSDALEDADGDRIPNVYEFANGTNPANAASIPTPHVEVDAALVTETTTKKKTIRAAVNACPTVTADPNRFSIIFVKRGIYTSSTSATNIDLVSKRVLLLGETGARSIDGVIMPRIVTTSSYPTGVRIYEGYTAIDGFEFVQTAGMTDGKAIYTDLNTPQEQTAIVNCYVHDHYASSTTGAIAAMDGRTTIAHCTLVNNINTSSGGPASLYVNWSANQVWLVNSVLWRKSGFREIADSDSRLVVTTSHIKGTNYTPTGPDPELDRSYGLGSGSPLIDAGTATAFGRVDRHGESRDATPDIGADEFVDTDDDKLPDWFELHYFTNLSKGYYGDDDTPTPDGLENWLEYILDFNPTKADSDNDGTGDAAEAALLTHLIAGSPEGLIDTDEDGLSDAREQILGTNRNLVDSNGDGINDGQSVRAGINPAGTDSDGDGVSNLDELAQGTSPLVADSDGDGVNDSLDAFPLDPNATTLPGSPGDTTPPAVTLTKPPGAVLVP